MIDDRVDAPRSILAVSSGLPWPLNSGGHLRTFHLLKELARVHRVTLVVPAVAPAPAEAAALRESGIDVRMVQAGHGGAARQAVAVMAAAARGEPYVMYRRHRHTAVVRALGPVRREVAADVLYFDHLDSFAYPAEPGPAVVGDLHNVYSTLLARTARDERRPVWRQYLAREARLLAQAEAAAARRADLLLTVSEDDRRHFSRLGAARVDLVPNGVDCAAYADLPVGRAGAPIVMFLGAMSWAPNAAAAEFLIEEVLPQLQARVPGVRLQIVGRDPSPRLRRLGEHPSVEVTGAVPDVRPYLREARVLAVPLQAGGGTRLKILEAFAAGLPVVSTPIGCEGIEVEPGRHLIVAAPEAFAQAVIGALLDPGPLTQLASAARSLVELRYDWQAVGRRASQAIAEVAADRRVS